MKQNNIWTVVVTYNAENWIANCLNSIFESTVKSHVVIVDNNSTDNSISIIKNKFGNCVLLENKSNKGFGSANNRGIRYALEKGANYIALLNQDAKLHPMALEKLLYYSEKYADYGILGPMFYSYDGTELDEFLLKWTYHYDLSLASDIFFQRPKEVYHVPLIPAAMWLMKKEALLDVGLFDPLFFMYKEDDDLWTRFQRKGWKTGFFPNAIVYHHTSKENSYTITKRKWYTYGNIVLNLKNPGKSFPGCLRSLFADYVSGTLSAMAYLNKSELYIRQVTMLKVLRNLKKIYQHRKKCIEEKLVFIQIDEGS